MMAPVKLGKQAKISFRPFIVVEHSIFHLNTYLEMILFFLLMYCVFKTSCCEKLKVKEMHLQDAARRASPAASTRSA